MTPATDFYKKFALDCAAEQVAVDLFLLSGQYSDIATLSKSLKSRKLLSLLHVPQWILGNFLQFVREVLLSFHSDDPS